MRSQSHPFDPRAARASRFRAVLGAAALALLFTGTAPAPDARAQAAAKSAPAAKTPAKKAAAKPAAPPRTGLETLEKQVREFTLPNGLEFIVVGRHDAPVFIRDEIDDVFHRHLVDGERVRVDGFRRQVLPLRVIRHGRSRAFRTGQKRSLPGIEAGPQCTG